jgi:DNA-binding beta-propeller fold protein YncE
VTCCYDSNWQDAARRRAYQGKMPRRHATRILGRAIALALCLLAGGAWAPPAASGSARDAATILPNGWVLAPSPAATVQTGTMPQGLAASPAGATLAVLESGYNPPAVSFYRIPDLARMGSVPLPGAFGQPLWPDSYHVVLPGANADALLRIDVRTKNVQRFALPKDSYPVWVAIAPDGHTYAVATAGDASVRIGELADIGRAAPIRLGGFPGGVSFGDNATAFATVRSSSEVVAIDVRTARITARRSTGLHPSQVLVAAGKVYVAENDADSVGVYRARDLRLVTRIPLGDPQTQSIGVSPNALSATGGTIFVSLGAANAVAVVRDDRLIGRMAAGWYPTGAVAVRGDLFVLDGKGEGTRANPGLRPKSDHDYIGTIEFGSLRRYPLPTTFSSSGSPQGAVGWNASENSAVVRANGPIRHVFFVVKENRSYDQVLGDLRQGNGDPALVWFGRDVTPNEHALAARFGLFDNAYTSGEVSAVGHMWDDAAFANDYVQRFWPSLYAGRSVLDDLSHGDSLCVPAGGWVWEAAHRAGVTFRDYGELVEPSTSHPGLWDPEVPSLAARFDPHYAGWNLNYSDFDRVKEWRREFDGFVRDGTLPQFEFIWLPNDHTYGSKPGKPTPAAYVASNDGAFGRLVDAISHSRVWGSSVIFAIEDDAQDGPDHVSDQRTTLFVISPYARGGVHHEHVSTVSIIRTIEIVLGMQPLSAYDAMARPMYASFDATPDLRPYDALAPAIDLKRTNAHAAYGAAVSARLDFSQPDAIAPATLNRILARNRQP